MALTKSQENSWNENKTYWLNRWLEQDLKNEKDYKVIEKKLKKLLIKVNDDIQKELTYQILKKNDLTKSEIEQFSQTIFAIDKALDELTENEEKIVNELLEEKYKEVYEKNLEILSLNNSFHTINIGVVKEAVKTNWSGLEFSERIWNNREKLAWSIKEEFQKGLIRGDSLQDISNRLVDTLNNSFKNTMRLVRTETCAIQSKATIDSYKEYEVEKVEFSAFIDQKTSPQCKEMDGKIIDLDKAMIGSNIPPLHPHCRSCILPVLDVDVDTDEYSIKIDKNDIPLNRKEIVKFLDEKLNIKTEGNTRLDEKLHRSMAEFLVDFTNKYPKLKDHPKMSKFTLKDITMQGSHKNTYAYYTISNDKITMNRKYFKNYDEYIKYFENDIKHGFHPPIDFENYSKGVFVHEFGHFINDVLGYDEIGYNSIDNYKNKSIKYRDKILSILNRDKEESEKYTNKDIAHLVSEYGIQTPRECFAEAFCEYMLSSNPRPFAKELGKLLEKDLEKYK